MCKLQSFVQYSKGSQFQKEFIWNWSEKIKIKIAVVDKFGIYDKQ